MRRSHSFLYLCLVGLCGFISYDMVRRPALALLANSLGANPFTVGLLVALSTVTGIFLKLPLGLLSDLMNRQRLMVGGVLAFAFPPFLYPFITDLAVLGSLRLFHGLATAMFTPLALATVAELYTQRRGEVFGWYTAATQGGGALGPLIGGGVIYCCGFSNAFLLAGLFGCLALFIFLSIPPLQPPTPISQLPLKTLWRDIYDGFQRVRQIRPIVITSVVEAAKMVGNGTLMAFLPLYGITIGLNAIEIGGLFGAQAVTSLIAKPYMGRISDRGIRQPLIVGGLCLCGSMVMVIPQISGFGMLLVIVGAFGFGEAVVTSSTTAFIADVSENQNLGAGMGLRGTIMDIGHSVGPVMAGGLIALLGYGGGFTCIGAVLLLVAGYFGWAMIGIQKPAVL